MTNNRKFAQIIFILYSSTIFLSSFLLFQVQPMIGKIILPWFGGGPAVWTTAMLFFQILLLGGYLYAHLSSRFTLKVQANIHLVLLGVIFIGLMWLFTLRSAPIMPDTSLKPVPNDFPVWQVLWVLLVSVGIPYLLLSTTSSLLQAWFSKIQNSRSPYPFYALSNTASLLALISYPVFVEPNWTLQQQTSLWSISFAIFLAFFAGCTSLLFLAVKRHNNVPSPSGPDNTEHPGKADPIVPTDREWVENNPLTANNPPSLFQYFVWVSLAACPSVLLLAVTNQISQDVAAVPFLWILPLSLYLISFILTFNNRLVRLRNAYAVFALAALGFGYMTIELHNQMTILQIILANAGLLFSVCLLFHATLYSQRPTPQYLTGFYLSLSFGGALGGILVSLIAPLLFPDYWEYPLALLVCAGVVSGLAFQDRGSWLYQVRFPILIASAALVILLFLSSWNWINGSIETYRNFYGVLRIRKIEYKERLVYNLVHGRIIHGSQALGSTDRMRPTRYYSPATGIGLAITGHPRRIEGKPLRIGMVGLGIGTVAAYGLPGDTIRFFEINPIVEQIAKDRRYFSYLEDSSANIEIIIGDARLSMEKEASLADFHKYDLLAIDAFSGDSIPTHLITKEAAALYLQLLKEDGILAFHISNRYLNLEPIVGQISEEFGLIEGKIVGGGSDWLGTQSTWILLSRDPVALGTPVIRSAKLPVQHRAGMRIWTDDFNNLFEVLR